MLTSYKIPDFPRHVFTGLPASVTAVSTSEAARLLCRKPQTLREWSAYERGPIRPVRLGGKLLWRVADIERLLSGGQ
jgi:hypothetical protein